MDDKGKRKPSFVPHGTRKDVHGIGKKKATTFL
jgi:hypothetical protein